MSIYVDISAAVHGRAGLGRYAESLAEALLVREPGRFALFCNRTSSTSLPPRLRSAPLRTVRAGYKPWRMAVLLGQMAHLGFDSLMPGAELLHATEHLLMPMRHAPCVLTIHDLVFRLLPHHHKPLNYAFLNLAMPFFIRRADHLIAVSHCTRRDLCRLYRVDPDRISVIYEAADRRFRPRAQGEIERIRQKHGLPEQFILSLGTLEPRKNYGRLIEAFAQLRRRCDGSPRRTSSQDWRLVIVGRRGWLYQPFFQQLEESGVRDQVIIPEHMPDEDLPALYSAAGLFVFPSLYEGFGLPPLEAMACGTPVVCSRSSSLPEVGGVAARYFSPANTEEMAQVMHEVLTDEARQAEMRELGLEQAKHFSWHETAGETMDVYERVVRSHSRT